MSGHTPSEHLWLEVTDSLEVDRRMLMYAEMIPGSNHLAFIPRKGIEKECCTLYRQHKPRTEKICHFSGPNNRKHSKSPCLGACLRFCFKNRGKMEQREQAVECPVDGTEGRLRELAFKWFIETQVHLIVHNGFFPTWFLGFITRKDAEEILREKELGCFLIRLSDKAIGYILSYRGRDRCRHFVINQSESGQFIVCGDTEAHATVSNLIEYYKTSPIEPFGEYLTSSCYETLNEDLYDTIQFSPKEKPVATVRAVKHVAKKPINTQSSEQPPTRPPKSKKTLEEVPPLPRRSRHLENGLLDDQDRVLYAQLRKQVPREAAREQAICQDNFPAENPRRDERCTTLDQHLSRSGSPPDSIYSELEMLDSRSKSLPLLASSYDGEQSYRLSVPPQTPPRLSPRPIRQAHSHGLASEAADSYSRPTSSHSLDYLSDTAIYHLAGRPGSPHTPSTDAHSSPEHHCDSLYAEVSAEGIIVDHFANTYEQIPGHKDTARPKPNGKAHEALDDIRPKQNHSSWGLKNDKWKWLFPDAKRKW
ncbi:SH2 domain-containing protein 7-like [Sphaeramia orbicularis]|uniref:SH2 domain-containing protein 7-like n=1 Tax=Sphaeramia orbicularis TaxID=375764 RepID=A0A673CVL2_9TELE|nr:SH2 domain-containing protein 7-like [Sphaeramia orbicularis]